MSSHQESDEEMAARLQQEELSGGGYGGVANHPSGGGARGGAAGGGGNDPPVILQRLQPGLRREDNRAVHRNFAANLQDVREHSPRIFAVNMFLTIAEVLTTAIILFMYWDKSCDKPMQLWLLVFTMRHVVLIPLAVSGYLRHRPRVAGGPPAIPPAVIAASDVWESKVKSWLNFLTFVWFIVGQSWLYASDSCKAEAPALYTYCLILIILVYVTLAFPIILLLCLCLCFPCVLLFFRVFAEPAGAPEQAIRQLPTRVFQAPPAPARNGNAPAAAEDAPSCAICMENYNNGDRLRALPCRHEFHNACVDHWLTIRSTCPLCRHPIGEAMPAAAPHAPTVAASRPATGGTTAAAGAASGSAAAANSAHSSRSNSGSGSGTQPILSAQTIAVRPASGSGGSDSLPAPALGHIVIGGSDENV